MFCPDETQSKYISRELFTALHMVHPNIIQMLGLHTETKRDGGGGPAAGGGGEEVVLVMELMDGSLSDVLYKRKERPPDSERIRIALQVARAMAMLHARGILHRDLKSANILVSSHGVAKVCDFGLARRIDETQIRRDSSSRWLAEPLSARGSSELARGPSKTSFLHMTVVGSPPWTAPEVLLEKEYGLPVDVFSFGAVLFELISVRVPPMRRDTTTGNIPWHTFEQPEDCPGGLWELMMRCTTTHPLDRPTFVEIIERLDQLLAAILAVEKAAAAGSEEGRGGE